MCESVTERERREPAADGEITDGLWRNQVTEERGEHDEDHGICDPGQVLQRHVALQLPVDPLIG